MQRRMAQIEESVARYLHQLDSADRQEPSLARTTKTTRLKEKIAKLKEEMQRLETLEARMLATPDHQISLTDPDSRSMATSGRGSGEGVVAYLDLLRKAGHDAASARKRASAKLGIPLPRLSELNTAVSKFSEDVKEAVRDGKVALRTALAALNHGGPKMAKTAAAHSMALRSMDAVKKSEAEIEDLQIRTKVHTEVSAGKLSTPKEIRERVRELLTRKLKKEGAPSDLAQRM
jgi:hypothetical protein